MENFDRPKEQQLGQIVFAALKARGIDCAFDNGEAARTLRRFGATADDSSIALVTCTFQGQAFVVGVWPEDATPYGGRHAAGAARRKLAELHEVTAGVPF